MKTVTYDDSGNYPIAILVPFIKNDDIEKEYLNPFGIDPIDTITIQIHQSQNKKKTPVKEIKQFVQDELVNILSSSQVKYVVCGDSEYFKVLTKNSSAEPYLGYVLDSVYGDYKVVYVPNFRQIFYDPDKIRSKIKVGIDALIAHAEGAYVEPGSNIIHKAHYLTDYDDIKNWLNILADSHTPLAIDIEAFSLNHWDAGIGTITFCWSEHEGIAFPVDYKPIEGATQAPYGENVRNDDVRLLLKLFFNRYLGRAMYHNISYDVRVLIYQLYMSHLLDNEGLLDGLDVMMRNWDCTKIITYLATNSCAGNELGLKKQAQEFAGNYAQDEIKDIRNIPLDKLLEYNLVDGLSTYHTYRSSTYAHRPN